VARFSGFLIKETKLEDKHLNCNAENKIGLKFQILLGCVSICDGNLKGKEDS